MRILLTGASGFIGRHLLDALLREGHDILAASRSAPHCDAPGMRWIAADFTKDTEQSVWLARISGVEAVINTVGIFREEGAQTFAAVHTQAPAALFAACAAAGNVRRVIQVSALGADDGASSAYHLSKKAADEVLARLPLNAVIVQPSLVYGKDGSSARLFRCIASMPVLLRFGRSPQLVQPIHVDDAVAAITALLQAPVTGRVALVGSKAMPFSDYLAALRQGMGMRRWPVLALPGWLGALAARVAGLLPGSLLNLDAWRMLERGNAADPAATHALLGRAPRPPAAFIEAPAAERVQAKLDWLLPVLRISIALVWLATAAVSFGLYPVEDSYALLMRSGAPAGITPLLMYGAAAFDLLLGLGILFLRRRTWLWTAQLALIGFYTVYIAFRLPEFLLHPFGPLIKNIPMLAAIWLLAELDNNKESR